MKSFIRNRSALTEFCFVVLLWIGPSLIPRIVMLLRAFSHSGPPPTATTFHVRNDGMLWMAVWELLMLALMWWIGRIRGWSFKPFGLRPTWNSTAAGIFLFSIFAGIYWFARLLLNWVYPATPSSTQILSELTFPFMALIVVVNPIYEESFWEGYLFQALRRHGVWIMVLTSALLRTLCHAHLGLRALVTILPMGLVYALIYWRWRQLWPLVVAHALEMLYSLMRMHYAQRPAFSASSYGNAWLFAEVGAILLCLFIGLCVRKQTALIKA